MAQNEDIDTDIDKYKKLKRGSCLGSTYTTLPQEFSSCPREQSLMLSHTLDISTHEPSQIYSLHGAEIITYSVVTFFL